MTQICPGTVVALYISFSDLPESLNRESCLMQWPGLISTVFAVIIITFLANDRPAVFSLKWFLIGFWLLIIFLNTFLLLPEKDASIFLSSEQNRSLVNNTDNKKIVENQQPNQLHNMFTERDSFIWLFATYSVYIGVMLLSDTEYWNQYEWLNYIFWSIIICTIKWIFVSCCCLLIVLVSAFVFT